MNCKLLDSEICQTFSDTDNACNTNVYKNMCNKKKTKKRLKISYRVHFLLKYFGKIFVLRFQIFVNDSVG